MAVDNARLQRSTRKHMLHFTYKEAKRLTSIRFSSVVDVLHDMSLSMSPKYIGNMQLGLKETLSKELLTYNEQLHGVPLAYNNIKVVDANVIDDQDLFKLDIKLSFVVFRPEPGEFLNAVVNKITDHHFGCVIHDCINGSVRQPKLDALTDEQKEITNDIEVGDVITFKVWRLDIYHGIMFVLGDIIGPCYYRTRRNKQRYTTGLKSKMDDVHSPEKNTIGNTDFDLPNSFPDLAVGKDSVSEEMISIKKENEKDDDTSQEMHVEKSPKKKKKKKNVSEVSPNKSSTIISNILSSDGVVESDVNSMEVKMEPADQDSQVNETVEKSPKKKKKKRNVSEESPQKSGTIISNVLSSDDVVESNVNSIEVKKELTDEDGQVSDAVEISPKKKKKSKEHSSTDTDDLNRIKSPKKKKKKAHLPSSPNTSNNQNISVDSTSIKEEPVFSNGDLVKNIVEKSPKKKKTVFSSDMESKNEETPKKNKEKENSLIFQSPDELFLTKKVYSGDKDTLNVDMPEKSHKKKKIKKELVSLEEIVDLGNDVQSSNDQSIKREPLSDNVDTSSIKSPKKCKNKSKYTAIVSGQVIDASFIDSPSKKIKRDVKDEKVSDNEPFASDQELAVKKKKIKKTYSGS